MNTLKNTKKVARILMHATIVKTTKL